MPKKRLKILFLCAHPDDLEYMIPNIIIEAVGRGHTVTIASMTKGEYGTLTPSLYGEKLARIRERELRNAARINGVNDVRFLGFTDGHVTYDKENIIKLKKFLDELKPDVIFCPECYFTFYWHHDHVNTGKMVHYILRKNPKKPLLFFFHSYKNNFFVPARHMKRARNALKEHYSQFQIIGFMIPLRYILMTINGIKLPLIGGKNISSLFVEACRKINFKKNENSIRNFLHIICKILKPFQNPLERKD